uniref:Uncharacterized protein n=1 Tax=Physcomitrium patens TaxID=3218 RepID=A0A2K1IP94_PHYPA|nr:hypothetical protein PHYPA_027417 [Physcomitrium patens]
MAQQQVGPPGAGRGRGMTLPAWMTGGPPSPGMPPGAGPPQSHLQTNPGAVGAMPPRMMGMGPSGPSPNFQSAPQMQQGQQFMGPGGQQYRPGVGMGPPQQLGMPPNMQGMNPQQPQQFPARPPPQQPQGQPSSQGSGMPFGVQQRPMTSTLQPPQAQQQQPSSHQQQQQQSVPLPPVPGNHTLQPASSYPFSSASSFSQPPVSYGLAPPYQVPTQLQNQQLQPVSQPWSGVGGQTNAQSVSLQPVQPPLVSGISIAAASSGAADWQEHVAPDGRRYYYNRRTKQSSWEKPTELMTPTERADASTPWKEFTTADGRKYYYNKVTKQSKWTMPDEMKLAREQAEKAAGLPVSQPAVLTSSTSLKQPASTGVHSSQTTNSTGAATSSTPTLMGAATTANSKLQVVSDVKKELEEEVADGTSAQELEEAKKVMVVTSKVNISPVPEEKPTLVSEEPQTYASKTEAKNAFKELLESVHIEADCTWEQAMRVIINDKRYGALKTLGERKQAFNEYLAHRKKQESEEKRVKQKVAREQFLTMLEECKDLTSSMRWSKALSMFEDDPRFLAVEKDREREELFEDYMIDLERKEREKAREERKKHISEYRSFLESCDFIKANTQWRKVQDRLEDDERCSRLDKLDRLEVFQEYIRELEKEEEEEKRKQKEQLRRKERKHRDEFRKLMDEHKAAGILTAKTAWRDYLMKVKDNSAYQAVASNTSGTTPKELFEDVIEELVKQYHEDKARAKDVMKAGKISVGATWTFDKFKAAYAEAGDLAAIAEPNLKLVFEDYVERAKEKEEKEAKKRRRMADDFTNLLRSTKAVTSSSKWEDVKLLIEVSQEYRALSDDGHRKKLFEEYVLHLAHKAKEKEKKRAPKKRSRRRRRRRKTRIRRKIRIRTRTRTRRKTRTKIRIERGEKRKRKRRIRKRRSLDMKSPSYMSMKWKE